MVNMNEEKERSASPKADVSKKTCPRAARDAKKSELVTRKPAHTGLRFHFDRKKLVTHEFSFNSVSKTEKVTRCRHIEKSPENQNNAESSKTTDSRKIEVLMDTLKISRSEECSSREKSPLRKEVPKSPVVERLTSKKVCTRCSRCSKTPKEEKTETKPLRAAKDQDQPPKVIKKENSAKTIKQPPKPPQSPKPVESKKQCSKLAKLQAEPSEKALKPKSVLIHSEKPASHDNEKNDASKNCEAPQSPKPVTSKKQCSKLAKLLGSEPQEKNLNAKPNVGHTEKSHSRDDEKIVSKICEKAIFSTEKLIAEKSHVTYEKKVEFAWPDSGMPESIILNSEILNPETHDKARSDILNGSEHYVDSDTKACLLNGTRHDEHICDPHLGLESPSGTRVSKIPRKTPGATGLKPEASLNKDTMPQLIEL